MSRVIVVNHSFKGSNIAYCGRGTALGNPFIMRNESQRDKVCDQYKEYFYRKIETDKGMQAQLDEIWNMMHQPKPVHLQCFCAPRRCHCDTIKEYLDSKWEEFYPTQTDIPVVQHRVIVAGGRDFTNRKLLADTLNDYVESLPDSYAVSLVSGMAKGADLMAWDFGRENNIEMHAFPADWETHGRGAGFIRNVQMAEFADALIAFWDGESRGTKHMIQTMNERSKPVTVIPYSQTVKSF